MNNRVFLLNPPPPAQYLNSFSIGLAYLSSVLRKNGYEVKAIDAAAPYKPRTPKQIVKLIKDFDPLYIGVSIKYDFVNEKYAFIKELKKLEYPVVAGGPHVNIVPEEVIKNGVDIACIGEGEDAVSELADAFNGKRRLEDIHGLAFRDKNSEIVFTPRRKEIKNLDRISFPDYSDYSVRDYTGLDNYASSKTYFNVFTSRGCFHRCTYCSGSRIWKGGQRNRSARNVFEEIVYLAEKHGAQYIAFMDDEPLTDKQRIYELCDLLEGYKRKVKISTRARIDELDERLLKRMLEVGFYRMALGLESGDEETLKKVRRFYTQKDILNSIKILDRIKFPLVTFNNLIGFPWETRKHFENTLKVSLQIPLSLPYFVNVFTPIPMPGTTLYEENYEKYGFKDWWLDGDKQKNVYTKDIEKPFYLLFIPFLKLRYLKVDFWKYPKSVKKDILKYQLKLQEIAFRRKENISSVEIALLMFFVRLSIRLHLFSPKIERTFFYVFRNKLVLKYAKKFLFSEQ